MVAISGRFWNGTMAGDGQHPRRRTSRIQTLTVRPAARLPGQGGPRGHVKAGPLTLACALGRCGVSRDKREGDGATPAGAMRVLYGYHRPDRMARPFCRVPLRPLPRDLGWCDASASPRYNRPARLPMREPHETMWRADGLYDVVFVLGYNIAPRRAGRGSAIFLHCAKPGMPPTLGCVALRPADMRRLLPLLAKRVRVVVL
jgi:L,D-peptidoglycan transpeptidase YkuD (ErfK/YbiS/YcfS/YnhG family)